MINIVIGGSHSGKTTFVRKTWLNDPDGFKETKLAGVSVSIGDYACAIGHYGKPTRTCGVDQMGRDYDDVRWRVLEFLGQYGQDQFQQIAMEGNALMTRDFMDSLKKLWKKEVKLWLMNPSGVEVQRRLKETGVNYGSSIISLSYRRAYKVWSDYKEVFANAVVH